MKYLIFIVVILVTLLDLNSCTNLNSGKQGISDSIRESKKKGFFFKEKFVIKYINYEKIGNGINIKQFWFEKMWYHGNSLNNIKIKKHFYQFNGVLSLKLPRRIIDSLYVLYDNKNELNLFDSSVYSYADIKLQEIPDSVVLDFYLKNNGKNYRIKKFVLK